jgi:hypothetical protein
MGFGEMPAWLGWVLCCLLILSGCKTPPEAPSGVDELQGIAVREPDTVTAAAIEPDAGQDAGADAIAETPNEAAPIDDDDGMVDAPVIFVPAEIEPVAGPETVTLDEAVESAVEVTLFAPEIAFAGEETAEVIEAIPFDVPQDITIDVPAPSSASLLASLDARERAAVAASEPVVPEPAVPLPPAPVVQAPPPPPPTPPVLRPSEPIVQNKVPAAPPVQPQNPPPLPARAPVSETRNRAIERPARTVSADTGSVVELPFEGTGWVYLGEQTGQPGIRYDSRRTDTAGQTFVLHADENGEYLLKFYRQDLLRDNIINDYVRLVVREAAATPELAALAEAPLTALAEAPLAVPATTSPAASSAASLPTAPARASVAPVTAPPVPGTETVPATPGLPAVPTPDNTADYLSSARASFDAGRFDEALASLDRYRERYPAGSDEAWWLYGQCFESPGAARNIRASVDAYRHIVRDFPQSTRRSAAQNRIAFLERFYFNIR